MKLQIYYCSPHRLSINRRICTIITRNGYKVFLPQDICSDEDAVGDQSAIRSKCITSIDACDILVVYLDEYGMDSSWELGYAEKAGKRIIGLTLDNRLLNIKRSTEPETIWDHWMHGWKLHTIVNNVPPLLDLIEGSCVYFSMPLKKKSDIEPYESIIANSCKNLITPWQLIDKSTLKLKRNKWGLERYKYINAIEISDTFVTYLDEYGMDSSWELGYAEKAGKRIIGLTLDNRLLNIKRSTEPETIWDHWMHNWHELPIANGVDSLLKLLKIAELKSITKGLSISEITKSNKKVASY